MQLLMARKVRSPRALVSTSATVHAPQSPSAQPSLLPVRPVLRSHARSEVLAEVPSTRTALPLRTNSKPGEAMAQ